MHTHTHSHRTHIYTLTQRYIQAYIHTMTHTYSTHTHTYRHTCTHTYIHIHVQTHIHTHTYTDTHRHTEAHTYTHSHRDTHTIHTLNTHSHMQTHTNMHTHTDIDTCTHRDTLTEAYTYAETHTHTKTYTFTQRHTSTREHTACEHRLCSSGVVLRLPQAYHSPFSPRQALTTDLAQSHPVRERERSPPAPLLLTFFSSTNSFSAAVRRLISSSYLQRERGPVTHSLTSKHSNATLASVTHLREQGVRATKPNFSHLHADRPRALSLGTEGRGTENVCGLETKGGSY